MTPQTARGVKRSAVHDRLAAAGAYFRDVSGWEGADWYAPAGHEPKVEKLSWGRQNWFPWWEAEHRAAREGVILMDMSFMSKFLVQGRDAGRVLNHISANNVDGEAGMITYTQWLNERGMLEADLTVTKLDDERFLVVVTDTMHRHAETWMRRHIPADAHAFVTDVTSGYCQLNVQGPQSRALLQTLTSADLSNEAFPFRTAREIDIGYARALCIRITYVGELGYELYIPAEQATHVYDRLVEAGKAFGLRHAGLKALASLRMEKGYRDYGHDIDNTDNAFETGLGFFVDLNKPGGFIGREAALEQKAAGPLKRRLVQVLVKDPEPMLFHAEVVLRDGKPVGYVRAGSYGHTLGGAVGLAMIEAGEPIDAAWIADRPMGGRHRRQALSRRRLAQAALRPRNDANQGVSAWRGAPWAASISGCWRRPVPSYASGRAATIGKHDGMHDITLTQVALFLAAAVVAAPLAKLLRIGNVLGYLLVGVLIGPAGLGAGVRRELGAALRRVRRDHAAVRDRPGAAAEAPVGHAHVHLRARQRPGGDHGAGAGGASPWPSASLGRPPCSPASRSRSPRPRSPCRCWRRRASWRCATVGWRSRCCCSRISPPFP